MTSSLPPAAPDVVAASVESLTSRLRKRLDAAVESVTDLVISTTDESVRVTFGEDAEVALTWDSRGVVREEAQAACSCLLAPRCLHRAAVLVACPVAEADREPEPASTTEASVAPVAGVPKQESLAGQPAAGQVSAGPTVGQVSAGPTAAQRTAAGALWNAAAAILNSGVEAAGAVSQADLLRALHAARVAGLYRAETAAVRVVRGVRAARANGNGHRTAEFVVALRELLLTTRLLADGRSDPALIGMARRDYRPEGSLQVHGVCREPVLTSTGYAGVVTHLVDGDGRWYTLADVRPGSAARAVGAGTAPVGWSGAALDHSELSRAGVLIAGVKISADGRLGAGRTVRATPVPGLAWTQEPLASMFGRSIAETATARLSLPIGADLDAVDRADRELVGCDLIVRGADGDGVVAHEVRSGPDGVVLGHEIRLMPTSSHRSLGFVANLRQIAAHPGTMLRVLGRLDLQPVPVLRPIALAPLPGAVATLRLPEEWGGRLDLGYERLTGSHFPAGLGADSAIVDDVAAVETTAEASRTDEAIAAMAPVSDSPLWRIDRLVEYVVAGGRRAAGESARHADITAMCALLRQAGFRHGAALVRHLVEEADRRSRDVFGRLSNTDPSAFAEAWLALGVYVSGTHQDLLKAAWVGDAGGCYAGRWGQGAPSAQ